MNKNDTLDELIDGAEELLTQLGHVNTPEIERLRDRVDHAIGDARRAIGTQGAQTGVRLRDIARTVDDYIRDYPWLAVTTGVLAAGAVAYVAGAVLGNDTHRPRRRP